jgi:hypothetical protein
VFLLQYIMQAIYLLFFLKISKYKEKTAPNTNMKVK